MTQWPCPISAVKSPLYLVDEKDRNSIGTLKESEHETKILADRSSVTYAGNPRLH